MSMYWVDFSFYCPRNDASINVYRLSAEAKRYDISCEVVHLQPFRNLQRFGARSATVILRFEGPDRDTLEWFVNSIHFS